MMRDIVKTTPTREITIVELTCGHIARIAPHFWVDPKGKCKCHQCEAERPSFPKYTYKPGAK